MSDHEAGPINAMHPADAADALQRLTPEEAREHLRNLPAAQAAAIAAELDQDSLRRLLLDLPPEQLGRLLRELPHHTVADFVQGLSEEQRRPALASLQPEDSAGVAALLRYPQDTAGGIMSDRFLTLRAEQTLAEAQQMLRSRDEKDLGDITYLYVTDPARRLLGVVSLRDLVFRKPERKLSEILNPNVRFLYADSDQEEIVREFEHYHFMALPVLDRERRLVGIVRAADAMAIARDEATEDMQLMVGLSGEERTLTPWKKSMLPRFSWLTVNLVTAFLAASVISFFESTIAKWTVLAVFLPVVAGQGGNAGVQTLTIIIRDLALGEISMSDARPALQKELTLGLINGLAMGVLVGVVGWLWKSDWRLGVVVGAAMLLNMLAAAFSGVLIPYGLKWLRVDPALASSIFLTTVTDVAGFFFFLGLAALAMHWWGIG